MTALSSRTTINAGTSPFTPTKINLRPKQGQTQSTTDRGSKHPPSPPPLPPPPRPFPSLVSRSNPKLHITRLPRLPPPPNTIFPYSVPKTTAAGQHHAAPEAKGLLYSSSTAVSRRHAVTLPTAHEQGRPDILHKRTYSSTRQSTR